MLVHVSPAAKTDGDQIIHNRNRKWRVYDALQNRIEISKSGRVWWRSGRWKAADVGCLPQCRTRTPRRNEGTAVFGSRSCFDDRVKSGVNRQRRRHITRPSRRPSAAGFPHRGDRTHPSTHPPTSYRRHRGRRPKNASAFRLCRGADAGRGVFGGRAPSLPYITVDEVKDLYLVAAADDRFRSLQKTRSPASSFLERIPRAPTTTSPPAAATVFFRFSSCTVNYFSPV